MKWLSSILPDKSNWVEADVREGLSTETLMVKPDQPISSQPQPLDLDTLKKYIPIRNLDDKDVLSIPHTVDEFNPGSVIFVLGDRADTVHYLVQGEISIQPNSDNRYDIVAGATASYLPLNSGKSFGSTAIAKTRVKVLQVAGGLTELWLHKSQTEVSCIELRALELPAEIADNRFFDSFSEAYRENKLHLPSLPDVAMKLQQAMRQDIGVAEAADILQIDAPIVTKLIQLANSPLYAPVTPVSSCIDAINRLGLDATRNLVLGISLKQVFNCKNPKLMKGMQSLWRNSLYLSSLSFVLAEESGHIIPDSALLAGLISDIGVIPLLHFADQYPGKYPKFEHLEQAIPYLRGPVGALVLHTLGFAEELTEIPNFAEDWFYEGGDQLSLIDVVILAKLHSYFSCKKHQGLPYINSIPAYAKLKDGELDPDFSLKVLRRANDRIRAAMSLLA